MSDSIWAKGDAIGISSTVGVAPNIVAGPYINLKYTTADGDGVFTGDTKLYYYNRMTLTAYYPFTGDEEKAPGTGGVIEANTGADKQKPENQPGIDFLWDQKTAVDKADFCADKPEVNFVFSHKMSKVTFTFQNSPEIRDEETGLLIADSVNVSYMVNYTIEGLVLDGTFNTNTGVCAVKDVESADLAIDVTNVENDKAVNPLILFPQTLSGGNAVLHIYTDELKQHNPETYQHYKCNLSFSDGEILPGYHYKYTIKVSKVGLIVGKMTVAPWVEEDRYMTATIDGDPFKKQ